MTRNVALLLAMCAVSVPSFAAITGVVMTSDGAPVSGARVSLFAFESQHTARARLLSDEPERVAIASASTDAKGSFSMASPKEAAVDLAISAAGFEPLQKRVERDEDLGAIALMKVEKRSGTVTAAGKPVAGALVVIDYNGFEHLTRTDAQGRYEAPDPRRARSIVVRHPDFAIDEEYWSGQAVTQHALNRTLSAGVPLEGRAERETGAGVAGATVFVDGWPLATTAEDGAFSIPRAPSRWSTLAVRTESLAGARSRRNAQAPWTIRVTPQAVVSGRVLDARSKLPVAGTVVRVGPRRTSPGADHGGMAEVDAKGAFRIAVAPGNHVLSASHPAYDGEPMEVAATAGQQVSKELDLEPLARVSGTVIDEDRKAVAAAFVQPERGDFMGRGPRRFFRDDTTVSGPDGRFTTRVPADFDVILTATRKGFPAAKSERLKFAPGERKTGLVLTIPSGIEVSGRVTDGEGKPLSGIAVTATEVEAGRGMMMRVVIGGPRGRDDEVVRTASDGTFSTRLREGTYDFHFRGEGWAPKSVRGQAVSVAEAKTVEVVLEPGVEISGRVTRGGNPVDGARVMIFAPGVDATAMTAPDGSFTLSDLAPGAVRLNVRKESEFIDEMRSVTAPARDVSINLPSGGRVTGRVVEKGSRKAITTFSAGVATSRGGGGMVMMAPPQQTEFASEDGSFTLENVPAGAKVIVASAPGYAAGRLNVDVEEGKTVTGVEIELDPGVRLIGKVTGPSGAPLSDVRVRVAPSATGSFAVRGTERTATTDASGEYVLDSLEAGEETIVFSHARHAPLSKTVTLKGAETRLDAQLSAGHRVTGVVVTDSGAPVAEAEVEARHAGAPIQLARTNASGTFELESLADGRYRFTAMKPGYADGIVEDVDVSAGAPVRITLAAGGTLYGRVTGLSAQELSGAMVEANSGGRFASAAVDANGSYRMEGVPAGTVRVSASVMPMTMMGRRTSGVQTVELEVGGTQQVDLAFRSDVVLRGRVTRNGAPLADATISFMPTGSQSLPSSGGTTDAQGQYSVSGLEEGEYTAYVLDMQRLSPYSTPVQVRGSATFDIDYSTGTVRGRVIDAATSEPVANASVQLRNTEQSTPFRMARAAVTDNAGTFIFDSVSPGTYVATASKDGFGNYSADIPVTDRGADDVELKLSRNDGVVMHVVDGRDGRTIRGVTIVYDAQGRVVYESRPTFGTPGAAGDERLPLAPGTYTAYVTGLGYAGRNVSFSSPSQQTVSLTPGGTLEIESGRSTPVRVRLIDAQGLPYPRYGVRTWREVLPGTTPFQNVAAGTYTLQILGDNETVLDSKQVVVNEGAVTRADV